MTTSGDPALVDTNVLVYALLTDCPEHEASRALLDRAQNGEEALCVTPQVCESARRLGTHRRARLTPGVFTQPSAKPILPRIRQGSRLHAERGQTSAPIDSGDT